MSRRSFVGALAVTGLGALALPGCGARESAVAQNGSLQRIGVQLYTVRDLMEQDVGRTLQAVAEIGFDEVETAGLFNLSPQQFRALLDRHGLVSPAAHIPIQALRQDMEAVFASAQTLGQRWVIVPWLGEEERTAEGYRRVAADLNRFGAAAAQRGLRMGYHNHEFEFQPLPQGGTGFDILLTETDPQLVDMELDLFWAVQAGRDPVQLFAQYPGRFKLAHVKDMADPDGAKRMTDVGQGEIDFARIIAQAEQAGLQHYFVEHDNPGDALASIRNSYQHLAQLSF